jgi:predicted PurR-regulated permease PerM
VFWVLLLFVIIQNLETYLLDPLLVGSSVGVHPLFQLLSVLGGVQVLGILGALIVPPWFAGASALVDSLYLQPKRLEKKAKTIEAKLAQAPTQLSP